MPIYHRKEWPKDKHQIVLQVKGLREDFIFRGLLPEARAEEARVLLELQTKVGTGSWEKKKTDEEKSFYDFCLKYAEHTSQHVSASTWSTRKFHVKNLVEYFHVSQGLRFSELTTTAVDGYKAWRQRARVVTKTRAGGKQVQVRVPGASGRTINNELKTLSTMRTFAADHPEHGSVPVIKLRALKEIGKGRVSYWTEAQVVALYRVCSEDVRGRRLLPILVFLANTGCRKGEAIHAQRRWVDLDKAMLRISPNEHWQPKSNLPREVPISDALLPFLNAKGRSLEFVFTSSTGKPYRCFPNKTFRRLVEAAGLVGGPHMLRHSFASAFLAETPDMFLLSQLLGHSHEKITKLYAHLLPGHLEKARNKVNMAPEMGVAALEAAQRWSGRRARGR